MKCFICRIENAVYSQCPFLLIYWQSYVHIYAFVNIAFRYDIKVTDANTNKVRFKVSNYHVFWLLMTNIVCYVFSMKIASDKKTVCSVAHHFLFILKEKMEFQNSGMYTVIVQGNPVTPDNPEVLMLCNVVW